jgi:uncharacterized membrane protein required for colicin V production
MEDWYVDAFISLILLTGIVVGYRKGLLQQFISLSRFIIAYFLAIAFYDELAPQLKGVVPFIPGIEKHIIFTAMPIEQLELYYYKAVAFALLLFGSKIILRIVSNVLDLVSQLPAIKQINGSGGAVLGFIESYIIVMIILTILTIFPMTKTVPVIESSEIAQVMIKSTPLVSNVLDDLIVIK